MPSRMRRHSRRAPKQGPSAFAPAKLRDGRSLTWEQLAVTAVPATWNTEFVNLAHTSGTIATRFRTLLPQNVVRGTVTLERVRGTIQVFFDEDILGGDFNEWSLWLQLQLIPIQDGAIVNAGVLSPRNAADLESNRILWRRDYYPAAGTGISIGAATMRPATQNVLEFDVKSRRRFDRALWALAMVADMEVLGGGTHRISTDVRTLFRASDGV